MLEDAIEHRPTISSSGSKIAAERRRRLCTEASAVERTLPEEVVLSRFFPAILLPAPLYPLEYPDRMPDAVKYPISFQPTRSGEQSAVRVQNV